MNERARKLIHQSIVEAEYFDEIPREIERAFEILFEKIIEDAGRHFILQEGIISNMNAVRLLYKHFGIKP